MALIKCPECGRQVSDRAATCPECGYPISSSKELPGQVAIKIGNLVLGNSLTLTALRSSLTVQAIDNGRVLGEGKCFSVMHFSIDKPTNIILKGKGALGTTFFEGIVKPKTRYELVATAGLFVQHYSLNEVDVIDSGF